MFTITKAKTSSGFYILRATDPALLGFLSLHGLPSLRKFGQIWLVDTAALWLQISSAQFRTVLSQWFCFLSTVCALRWVSYPKTSLTTVRCESDLREGCLFMSRGESYIFKKNTDLRFGFVLEILVISNLNATLFFRMIFLSVWYSCLWPHLPQTMEESPHLPRHWLHLL